MNTNCILRDGLFFLHTTMGWLSDSMREKLRPLTRGPVYDSFMLGLLNDKFADKERTAHVDVFILSAEKAPNTPIAWATVYHAKWIEFYDFDWGHEISDSFINCNEVSVFVAPSYRKKGHSTKLLAYTKERLRNGYLWVACPDDAISTACYAKSDIFDASSWLAFDVIEERANFDDLEDTFVFCADCGEQTRKQSPHLYKSYCPACLIITE